MASASNRLGRKHVTADDIRHFLLDRAPSDNFRLDDVETDDPTIAKAMEFVADTYNSMPPFVDEFDMEDIPFRPQVIMGAAAYCLRAKALQLARNEVEGQTEGGTTDSDKGRVSLYLQLASAFMEEVKAYFHSIKVSKNAESCWGII